VAGPEPAPEPHRGARAGAPVAGPSVGHPGPGARDLAGGAPCDNGPMDPQDLLDATLDIERHVDSDGWDQPTLLFALVPTVRIRAEQPELAERLGVVEGGPALTTFEQEPPPAEQPLDEFLAGIEWPEQIAGAAIVVERLVLPPEAEAALADRPDSAARARQHPDARDMRIVVAVARDGLAMCAVRARGADDDAVLTGPDLVPALAEALAATFR
jgi:hypothetical protein